MTEWPKKPVEWTKGNRAYVSVVFTWHLPEAYQRCAWYSVQGYSVQAGGPAVMLMPDYLASVATCNSGSLNALARHNPDATFTSRGCVRTCPFCAVPRIEGKLIELEDWEPRPIICDNNLLACSRKHFDTVIDRLKPLKQIDFNQGLDARLLTQYQANRMSELNMACLRLAWDNVASENRVFEAINILAKAGFRKELIRFYVLIGFQDTPEDALYRFEKLKEAQIWSYPMRFNPLDTLVKNSYIGKHWTHKELRRFCEYWSNSAYYEHIPFREFEVYTRQRLRKQAEIPESQTRFT